MTGRLRSVNPGEGRTHLFIGETPRGRRRRDHDLRLSGARGSAPCSVRRRFKALPHVLVADAGYGSEENYAYLERNDVRAFVKYNLFHKEQKRAFKKDPTQPKNWAFDELADEWTCGGRP